MNADLGQNLLLSTACTDGGVSIYTGGDLLALERYFEKEQMKCTSVCSNKRIRLEITRSRQRNYLIHSLTRAVINDAKPRGVTTLVVGDVTDIRTDKDNEPKNWGDCRNQKPHAWPFKKISDQLVYKGAMEEIAVVPISEAYTSQDCSCCNRRNKKNRTYRDLYVRDKCGAVIHGRH